MIEENFEGYEVTFDGVEDLKNKILFDNPYAVEMNIKSYELLLLLDSPYTINPITDLKTLKSGYYANIGNIGNIKIICRENIPNNTLIILRK